MDENKENETQDSFFELPDIESMGVEADDEKDLEDAFVRDHFFSNFFVLDMFLVNFFP